MSTTNPPTTQAQGTRMTAEKKEKLDGGQPHLRRTAPRTIPNPTPADFSQLRLSPQIWYLALPKEFKQRTYIDITAFKTEEMQQQAIEVGTRGVPRDQIVQIEDCATWLMEHI